MADDKQPTNTTAVALMEKRQGAVETVILEGQKLQVKTKDSRGMVRTFKTNVRLTEGAGFVRVGDKIVPTAKGVDEVNRWTALTVIYPETIIVNGVAQSNPYIEKDPATGILLGVHVASEVWGYSPTGQITCVQSGVYFNASTYAAQDIASKIKKHPDAGCVGTPDKMPTKRRFKPNWPKDAPEKTVNLNDALVFFPTHIVAGVTFGLWVDVTHPAISELFQDLTRMKFIDRIARRIAARNALQQHPAMGGFIVKSDGKGGNYVEVFGTIASDDKLQQAIKQTHAGERPSDVEIQDAEFAEVTEENFGQMKQAVDEIVSEEAVAAKAEESHIKNPDEPVEIDPDELDFGGEHFDEGAGDAGAEEAAEQPPAEAEKPAPPSQDEREAMKLLTDIIKGRAAIGTAAFNRVVKSIVGETPLKDIKDVSLLKKCLAAVNAEADKE